MVSASLHSLLLVHPEGFPGRSFGVKQQEGMCLFCSRGREEERFCTLFQCTEHD